MIRAVLSDRVYRTLSSGHTQSGLCFGITLGSRVVSVHGVEIVYSSDHVLGLADLVSLKKAANKIHTAMS